MLDEEGGQEADELQPERELADPLGEHAPGDLRKPVVDRGHHGRDRAGDQHEVEVRDDEVGVGDLAVDGEDREHHAGDAAEGEQDEEPGGEVQRGAQHDRAAKQRRHPVEHLHPVGTAIAIEESMKNASTALESGVANMWWAHTSIDRNAMPMLDAAIAL